MKQILLISIILRVCLSAVCHAEDPTPSPAMVEVEIKIRVACGLEPKLRLKVKDVSALKDLGPVDQWTDFDVAFSLQGVPWDVSPGEFVQIVSEKINKPCRSRLIAILSIYRWDEAKQSFAHIGTKRFNRAKGFLREIKEGDYLVAHSQFD